VELTEEQEAFDRVFERARGLARRALEKQKSEDHIYVEGTARLLDKPEFSDVDSLKRVLHAFDEKARLLSLFARYLESPGTCVVLGSEEALTEDRRLSAVLTSYRSGETLTGMLGVIGPARREYPRVIPVVELLGRALSDRLERRDAVPESEEE
jgi:heat-inducible transcriptional repressor